jgi:hypothetical protein
MLNAALTDETYVGQSVASNSGSYFEYSRKFMPVVARPNVRDRKPQEIELPLRTPVTILWTSDGREFPEKLIETLFSLRAIDRLGDNWDGYGAQSLNDDAVRPALSLIFKYYARQHPNLVPLPDGGIGLRWEHGPRELEVDILADGKATGIFTDAKIGEEYVIEDAGAVDDVSTLFDRYFRR